MLLKVTKAEFCTFWASPKNRFIFSRLERQPFFGTAFAFWQCKGLKGKSIRNDRNRRWGGILQGEYH
jgi:hypothetical protein